jgi:hypothetical protein
MFEGLAPTELVVAIADSQRQESRLMARRMSAVAELLGLRTAEVYTEDPDPGYMIVTGFQRTTAEVAAACSLSPAAGVTVSHAHTLADRLPKVAAVLAAGETDWRTVQWIITRTEFVSDSLIARLDWRLATRIAQWHCWSRQRIINAIDAIVRVMDPDAIRERVRREDKRHVNVIAQADGTAKRDGIVAAEAGMAFDKRLTEIAGVVCRDDPRTVDQRRADAVKAISESRTLACLCDDPNCPDRSDDTASSIRMVVNVIAGSDTVLGGGTEPGRLGSTACLRGVTIRGQVHPRCTRLDHDPLHERRLLHRHGWAPTRDAPCEAGYARSHQHLSGPPQPHPGRTRQSSHHR